MATVRALSLALLLAFCFAACACAAARLPTNRYISYAGVPRGRGQNSGGHPPGCSVWMVRFRCPNRWGPTPTNAGTTTAATGPKGKYMSQAALPSNEHQAPKKAGAKTGAAEGRRYIRPAAMAADKPCDRPGCPSRP
ncbi:unnamed protein product [Urochloa humidicola]